LEAAGADIIDLNMGCPMPKITKQGKGAALMRDVDASRELLRSMRAVIRVPFTVKIRGGWDDEHLNMDEARRGSTRARHYRRRGARGEQSPAGITSMAEARRMMKTGCANVMIGRGALGRPWVFDESYEDLPAAEQWEYRVRVIRRHCQLIMERSDARHWVTQMRKHLAWYTEGTFEAAATRDRLFRAKAGMMAC
jgi:tRNA-dihydrouridine synthase